MIKEKTIFDYLNNINNKTGYMFDQKDKISMYLISLWLSHDNKLIEIINDINKYLFTIPDEMKYKFFYEKISKSKRFLKWVKKDKTEENKNLIENTSYPVSKHEISKYSDFTNLMKGDKIKKKK